MYACGRPLEIPVRWYILDNDGWDVFIRNQETDQTRGEDQVGAPYEVRRCRGHRSISLRKCK